MKKLLSLVLALGLLFVFAGCDTETVSQNGQTSSAPSVAQPPEESQTTETVPETAPEETQSDILINQVDPNSSTADQGESKKQDSTSSKSTSSKSASSKSNSSKSNSSKSNSSKSTTSVSNTKAKQIALNHAGVTASQIRDYDIELDYKNGVKVWDIDFEVGKDDYEYTINASSGKILTAEKNDKNLLAAQTSASSSLITKAKAKSIALKHANLKEADVFAFKAELDQDDPVKKWEIEFKSGKFEYEYEINAKTGKIIKSEKDIDD